MTASPSNPWREGTGSVVRAVKIVGGSLLTIMGLVWTLQGLGSAYVPTSFMTNATAWVVIGLITATAGVTLVLRTLR